MSLAPGTRLGAYEIVALIGAGGMGEVYRARDPRLGRNVAVKVLPAALSADPERMRRFEQEARATAALNHPNILAIYDVGTVDAQPYVVAELLEGEGLDQRIASAALPLRKTLDYALQLAHGLAAAHDRGVVHRDLKPANIFITAEARVKILDFGLAKLTEPEPAAASSGTMLPTIPPATTPGLVLGTIGYMSPEQVRGLPADHRSDIFSFGAILYEMLSGRRAFAGATNADTMTAILREDPTDLPSAERHIPPALARIVDRCLEKQPGSRFQSAGDLAFAIEALSVPSGIADAVTATTMAAPTPRTSRAAWMAAAVLGVGFVAAAIAAAALYFNRAPPKADAVRFLIPPPAGTTLTTGALRLSVSPDGRHIAFVARNQDGRSQLWVRALDTLSARALEGTDGAGNPFWSPDSRFVGFFSGGKLKKIDVTGGPPIVLCDVQVTGLGGTWNRDGVIVFGSGSTLFRVPASGGQPTPASTQEKGEGGHSGPSFLPDGRHFLFSVAGAAGGQTGWRNYVGTLDSMQRTRVPDAAWPKASYTGGFVLFPRDATLMAQRFDVNRFVTTGEAHPVADEIQTISGFGVGLFSVSDTGVLAYQTGSDTGGSKLIWMDRAGKALDTHGDRASYSDLQFSPDAQRATVSILEATQGTRDVWTLDLIRGSRTRFTFDPADDSTSAWSPEGDRIVFNSRRKGRLDLYVKSSSGAGSEELLFSDGSDKLPTSWSPDGRYILYASVQGGGIDLFLLPMFGDKKPIPFAQTPFMETPGQFSPDGKWIAYGSDESGRPEVYVAAFPGPGGKWQVSTSGGLAPRWRRDGQEIFYVTPAGRLMAANVSAQGSAFEIGAVTPLFTFAPFGFRLFYDVAPDGQRFLVNTVAEAESSAPITVVLNWQESVKK